MKRSLLLSLLAVGCSWGCVGKDLPEGSDPLGPGGVVELNVKDGKADNYVSTSAQEYKLLGSASAALPEGFDELDEEAREQALDEAVASRLASVSSDLKRHIQGLVREANTRRDAAQADAGSPDTDAGVFDSDAGASSADAGSSDTDAGEAPSEEVPDFFIYVKPSYQNGEAYDVRVEDGELAAFDFELQLVGSNDLIGAINPADGEDGRRTFTFEIDSATGEEKETLEIEIRETESTDSFPAYDKLFADGVYDIAIHFGGDYNADRYDLETAKWTVEFLLEQGWTNESVATFEDLKADSPPFVQKLQVEGRDVEAHVYLYHAQMDDDAGADQTMLRELVELSVASRDVVIYSGHAGSNAGFILDYHPRYEVDDDEFADLPMSDKYQIFVLDGCNSYRTYVEALMENPQKSFENTDLVTTVNTTPFSAGYEIIHRFVHWLTITDDGGNHYPISWNTLLRGVNEEFSDVHYGVHGIDQGPKLNPHASEGLACQSCEANEDCGAGGNYCLNLESGAACGVACTTDSACPEGHSCVPITDDPDLFYVPKQCIPTNLSCE